MAGISLNLDLAEIAIILYKRSAWRILWRIIFPDRHDYSNQTYENKKGEH